MSYNIQVALSKLENLTISIAKRLDPNEGFYHAKHLYPHCRALLALQTTRVCGLFSPEKLRRQENNSKFIQDVGGESYRAIRNQSWQLALENSNTIAGMMKLGFFGDSLETIRFAVEHDHNFIHGFNQSITDPLLWCPREVVLWSQEAKTWSETSVLPSYMDDRGRLIDKDLGISAHKGYRVYINYMAMMGAMGPDAISYIDPSAILAYSDQILDPVF